MLVWNIQDHSKAVTIDRVSELIHATGTQAYGAEVLASFTARIPIDSAILFCFEKGRPTCIQALATNCSQLNLDQTAKIFAHSFSHLDPNAHIVESEPPESSRIFFTRTEHRDIFDQRYWQTCWQKSGVIDRCSYIAGDRNKWWALNLYRERTSAMFSEGELGFLMSMGSLVGPLTRKHLEFQPRRSTLQDQLSIAADRLDILTDRERQVCRGIVRGQTAQGIAIDLAIGVTSVATYRKRAYDKLGISTRHELLEICMDRISRDATRSRAGHPRLPAP